MDVLFSLTEFVLPEKNLIQTKLYLLIHVFDMATRKMSAQIFCIFSFYCCKGGLGYMINVSGNSSIDGVPT